MVDLILRIVRAILASLYVLFEGIPALDSLRSWFGAGEAAGVARARLLYLVAAAGVLSLLACCLFLWFLSRRPLLMRGRRPDPLVGFPASTDPDPPMEPGRAGRRQSGEGV
jgi:hypothetical protein